MSDNNKTKPNQTKPLEKIVYARSIGERGWVISIPSTWFNIWLFICSYVFTTHTVYTSARSTHFVNECERKNMQSALKERELTRAYARSSHPIRIDRVWILYLLLCAHQRIFDFAPVQNIFYGRCTWTQGNAHRPMCVCNEKSGQKQSDSSELLLLHGQHRYGWPERNAQANIKRWMPHTTACDMRCGL